jgi:ribosomal protein L29
MKAKDLRKKSRSELETLLVKCRDKSGKENRKDVARIMTILCQKEN